MIINKLSKKRHYIFCDIENDDITIEITVKMLIQHVWKLHELSLIIVSNRNFQFVSIVWKTFCKIFDIVFKFSIAFYFETDDQFEIANQKMKRHFRTFCNHHQDNWFEILSMTKFVVNECYFAFIEIFFFMITKDFNSRMNFDVIDFSTNIIRERILKRKTANITKEMNEIRKFVIENMKNAQKKQVINANEHRKDIKYEVKNLIWVSIKNIITNKLSKKLDHKMIESYSIIKIVDAFYQVQLFESVKIFDIFHFNLLRKTFENSLFEQVNEFASSIVINDEKKWKVNDILDVRKYYRRVQFFVKWKKHDENKTWYDSKRFRNAFDIVKEFYDRYFDKSRSNWLKQESNQRIWWFRKENSVTNILFVLRSKRDATLIDAIESSRHRKLASSKARIEKWWDSREVMKELRSDDCLLCDKKSTSSSTSRAFRAFCILGLKYPPTFSILFLFSFLFFSFLLQFVVCRWLVIY